MSDRYTSDLDRLCRYAGILSTHRSVTGETIRLDIEGRIKLLAAMGIRAETAPEAARSLHDLEAGEWGRTLDEVAVVRVDRQPVRILARLPEKHLHSRWALRVIEESGRMHHCLVEPSPLRFRRIAGRMRALCEILCNIQCGLGYHRLELIGEFETGEPHVMSFIVCPPTAFVRANQRAALTLQNYALCSRANSFMGIGTFREIRHVAGSFPEMLPGLSPLHALFYSQPERRSPYSPSSRYWLNPFLLDLEAIPEWGASDEARRVVASADFQRERTEVCKGKTIPYARIAALRNRLLEPLFKSFHEEHYARGTVRGLAFARFVRDGGRPLRDFALFESLAEHFGKQNRASSLEWPAGHGNPEASGARDFAELNHERLLFFQYLQYNCRAQLRRLEREQSRRGSGLYLDLAVGAAPDGSDVWNNPSIYARASIGAPPDAFAREGQDWGLAPYHPLELKRRRYRPFIDLLKANMPRGGVLRLDHVMGLARLYWTGSGGGGYVRYPFEDLTGILALESGRRACEVIGEDLGTLPENMRETLREKQIYSFRVLYFEKSDTSDGVEFLSPASYPQLAAAAVNTHDLPTLHGFFQERDIALRNSLGLLDEQTTEHERSRRRLEIRALLRLAGLDHADADVHKVIQRIHALLGNSPARLHLFSLHDLLEEEDQPNLPGTVDEYDNWALRYSRVVEEIAPEP